MIAAKVICDSIANGIRLTTLELCYPRFIHNEVMTHRMFSRNASSSRAIPVQKMIDQVKNSPAMPIHWGKNQPGMQAKEEFDGEDKLDLIEDWREASIEAIHFAQHFSALGVHKQVANRLLEPFQWIKVIVTATEWDNFFVLRLPYEELNDKQRAIADSWKERFKNNPDGKDAQPEIQELARCMKKAMEESTHAELKPGEWHLPYVSIDDHMYVTNFGHDNQEEYLSIGEAIKCSTARIARISYNNHDGSNPVIEKDIGLHDGLLVDGHMSPFEHVATPMLRSVDLNCNPLHWEKGVTHMDRSQRLWSANFRGFIQYRQLIEQGAA